MTQLRDLAQPFSDAAIKPNPSGGGSYVPHPLYKQRLLLHLGGYDFELVEIVRGDVAGKAPNPSGPSKRAKEGLPDLRQVVVGAVCRLRVVVDERLTVIEDVGDCEDPHNWPHDGARLKDAMSDALKRCAAHLGLGLHLYCDPAKHTPYFLASSLDKREGDDGVSGLRARLCVACHKPLVGSDTKRMPNGYIHESCYEQLPKEESRNGG